MTSPDKSTEAAPKPFLTARWRWLAMLNYSVDRSLLDPLVPAGTDLDGFQGKAYVSVVGFLFQNTRVKGLGIPFHQDFEEVNLRFYVRRFSPEATEWRRGVVFISEIVPKPAVAAIARWVYNENYSAYPMSHRLLDASGNATEEEPVEFQYGWTVKDGACQLDLLTQGDSVLHQPGTLEEFITEHYWGYTSQKDGSTVEYRVEHPQWRVWQAASASLVGPLDTCYGPEWSEVLRRKPDSAFLAEGSEVTVYEGRPIQ